MVQEHCKLFSNIVAVLQISGFSDSGEVFKIKDNGHDYKYKSPEGTRFLLRNNLFLPFRHHFAMVKGRKMARDQEGMKKGLNNPQETGPAAVLQRA